MEGCFTFQWGDCIFKWRVHPMGGISFDWGFSKKIIGWEGGGVPPPCPPHYGKPCLLSYQMCFCCYDPIAKISGQYMTLITLKEMSEDQNHAGFESLKKSPALMKKLCNFNAESLVSKQLQVDKSVMVEHFYSFTTVPFISTYWRNEMHVFT